MSAEALIWIVVIGFLLVFSAFFSASETAITAAMRSRVHRKAQAGSRRAQIAAFLIENRPRVIGAILLGNNLVNILASALATSLFLNAFGEAGIFYATLAMTALIVILAELLPKTWAIVRAERAAIGIAPVLRAVLAVLGPAAAAAQAISGALLAPFERRGRGPGRAAAAREELRGAIALHHHEGAVIKGDRDMLGGILDLDEIAVSEVMIPRTDMAVADADLPALALAGKILDCGHSRVPLWRGQTENVIGFLHVKDLLRAIVRAQGRIAALDVPALARAPWFVVESVSLRRQLSAFLERKSHCAFVVDEYGGLLGMVTLEDILEEIVGEISDEDDRTPPALREEAGWVFAQGSMTIRDLNRALDWRLPDDKASTIAGLVIEEAGEIPQTGRRFSFHGVDFEIVGRKGRRITGIRMRRADGGAASGLPGG